jgi:hypothetical protein
VFEEFEPAERVPAEEAVRQARRKLEKKKAVA